MPRALACSLLAALAWLWPAAGAAHSQGYSFSDVQVQASGLSVILEIDPQSLTAQAQRPFDANGSGLIEPTDVTQVGPALAQFLARGYVVRCAGETPPARVEGVEPLPSEALRIGLWYACDETGAVEIEVSLLDHLEVGHTHFLTARLPSGLAGEVLRGEARRWKAPLGSPPAASAGRFLALGIEHILIGYDHLLFLFALLLLSTQLGELVRIVTAFTLAHSITLIAAALGVVALPGKLVEAGIALTIAYVGFENLAAPERGSAKRWRLTFLLGLIHGFGFASLLADAGLPAESRVLPLLAFNVGVELGQLAVVLLLIPALRALRRPDVSARGLVLVFLGGEAAAAALFRFEPGAAVGLALWTVVAVAAVPRFGYDFTMRRLGSAAIVGLGLIWFVLRLW